ncbi:DEAD/DEAH box helicase, partial [Ramlibacter sp.]|uniref:DEAD/DEAH box helicase n=1 Tax=Ramlibacter sp. TaxID=1917967 RepID=UPI002C975F6C
MIDLRYYQREAIDALYDYFAKAAGNPVVDLPTGSGKSLVIGGFTHRVCSDYPDTTIMVLTHRRELIEQDAAAITRVWPGAPVGVWSAGLDRFERNQITVAGIQSVYRHPGKFAPVDLALIDECHLIGSADGGMYRRFLYSLKEFNPYLKVVGFSATPYRMDSGLIIEGENRIFTDIAYSADVGRLIREGYLCPLVPKGGKTKADLSGLHRRGGEFVPAELADRMDQWHLIDGACREVIAYGQARQSWLFFCCGVAHAEHVAHCLRGYGIAAEMVCGDTPTAERDRILGDFKAGRLQAVTNADVLTTGFDHPAISLIALLRPTLSTGLYVQMLGRGLRLDSSKTDCLVLDFAGNVLRHGPLDAIQIKKDKKTGKKGVTVTPAKECPQCQALVHVALRVCDQCGHEFEMERRIEHDEEADDAPLIAALQKPLRLPVTAVRYYRFEKTGQPPKLRVVYQCGPLKTYTQFVPVEDPRPFVRKHAIKWFNRRGMMPCQTVDFAMELCREGGAPIPKEIEVRLEGKYWNVINEIFDWGG